MTLNFSLTTVTFHLFSKHTRFGLFSEDAKTFIQYEIRQDAHNNLDCEVCQGNKDGQTQTVMENQDGSLSYLK